LVENVVVLRASSALLQVALCVEHVEEADDAVLIAQPHRASRLAAMSRFESLRGGGASFNPLVDGSIPSRPKNLRDIGGISRKRAPTEAEALCSTASWAAARPAASVQSKDRNAGLARCA
jgi:hypothetical protein